MKVKLFKYLCGAVLILQPVYAETAQQELKAQIQFAETNKIDGESPTSPCEKIQAMKDVLLCALARHPKILRALADLEKSSKAEGKASAIPNPEVSTKTTYGKSLGDHLWSMEGSLDQKIEIGGKRSSRIKLAQSEYERAQASLKDAQEDTFIEMIHILNRHRQIHEELEVLDEAITAFQRVNALYKKRGRLSAEQSVSSEIFELALGEHRMRRANVFSEKEAIVKSLELILGQNLPEEGKYLPKFKKAWPELPNEPPSVIQNGHTLVAASELKAAEAGLKAARAESWPDLTIGPVMNWDREGGADVYRYGFNLSLPLPLWNWNRSGKAYAEREKSAALQNFELVKKETANERQQLVDRYRTLVGAIVSAPDLKEMEIKHGRIEKLFEQGLVTTSLFIEAHRQIQEFTQARNEQEHEANDALWKVYAIDGRILEEDLWNSNF